MVSDLVHWFPSTPSGQEEVAMSTRVESKVRIEDPKSLSATGYLLMVTEIIGIAATLVSGVTARTVCTVLLD